MTPNTLAILAALAFFALLMTAYAIGGCALGRLTAWLDRRFPRPDVPLRETISERWRRRP